MKSIKFSHDYCKMDWPIFTTLRRVPYCGEGEVVECRFPSRTIYGRVLNIRMVKLKEIPRYLICLDTWVKDKPMPDYIDSIIFLKQLAGLPLNRDITEGIYALITLLNLTGENQDEAPDWQKTDPQLDAALTETVKNDALLRLKEIQTIIEDVDNRCMVVDGDVTPTLDEMTQKEIRRIYHLAKGEEK